MNYFDDYYSDPQPEEQPNYIPREPKPKKERKGLRRLVSAILVLALLCSVAVLAAGKRYSIKQFEMLKSQIAQLLDGDEALAESLLDGAELPEDCQNREEISRILEEYRTEQVRIQQESEENQKKRPKKRRILKMLTEKKDKGEWI